MTALCTLKETRGLAFSWLGLRPPYAFPVQVLLLLGGLSCPAFAGLPINFPFPTLELGAWFSVTTSVITCISL